MAKTQALVRILPYIPIIKHFLILTFPIFAFLLSTAQLEHDLIARTSPYEIGSVEKDDKYEGKCGDYYQSYYNCLKDTVAE